MYAVIPAPDPSYNEITAILYQMLKLTPSNPMPEYLGKIDSVGY